jgi:hypothetical protein
MLKGVRHVRRAPFFVWSQCRCCPYRFNPLNLSNWSTCVINLFVHATLAKISRLNHRFTFLTQNFHAPTARIDVGRFKLLHHSASYLCQKCGRIYPGSLNRFVLTRTKIMKAFGRLLNVLLAVALVFALCGGNTSDRVYACSAMSSLPLENVDAAPCACCAEPAACCPTEPVPSNQEPLDTGSSIGESFTAKTVSLLPVRLLANANVSGITDSAPQGAIESKSKSAVSPIRLYLVFRALLI